MSGYKGKNNMKIVLIPRAKQISSLVEDREKKRTEVDETLMDVIERIE